MVTKKYNEIIQLESYAIIKLSSKKYGEFDCLIDVEDINKVKKYYWSARIDKRHLNLPPYVDCIKNKQRIHLHRLLINCPKNMVIDHINHNPLDNRKNNLRIVSQQQNCLNKQCEHIYFCQRGKFYEVKYSNKIVGRYRTYQEAEKKRDYCNSLLQNSNWDILKNLECENLTDRKIFYVAYNNTTKTVKEWSKIFNIPYSTLLRKIKNGLSIDDIIKSDYYIAHNLS